ncbi:ABC transporter ATP-binding protein [Desulfosarcina ovata subsp. sediminis]|uniref:ABC transporter ATP-binding protein n=1 Tax=Desulfosarcina ovata subsp. sediminis TaxID=885957 RepID=A0A5K7ZLR7_9BACT|nr:dipeptide/oligopeptide/nickel ABC transporter ATP-binding protein [Desulfosarcina ovata]BBO82404.1 ABC transporter ATP-binding protein [Desulfosarcina ovata subsp. sediminis]
MLALKSIFKSYPTGFRRRHVVLADVSLLLTQGRIIGLVGPSGCGKSTLGRIILGLEQPDRGRVLFHGRDIRHMNRSSRMEFRRNVQMVPQHPDAAFNPCLSIGASLREVFRFHAVCPRHEQADYLEATLQHVCVPPELLKRHPMQLSGGEIQRLAIARAILTKPALLVLDEATSMVDVSVQAAVIHTLRDLHREHGTAYLFITHDMALANAFCDEILCMESCGGFANGAVARRYSVVQSLAEEQPVV